MDIRKLFIGTVGAVLFGAAAQASVVSCTGECLIIAAPPVVDNSTPVDNDHLLAFDEVKNLVLAANLAVDGGEIAAGSRIASHMIMGNQDVSNPNYLDATFTFGKRILGVISSRGGLVATHALLGAPGTDYSGLNFPLLGFEPADFYVVSDADFWVSIRITQPGDWMRVITAVPVPAAGLLLPAGLALLGFGASRRRRKAA